MNRALGRVHALVISGNLMLTRTPSLLLILLLATSSVVCAQVGDSQQTESRSPAIIPIAVLGDSDSHSYRDSLDNAARGGSFHELTFNWPALWQQLRNDEVDFGHFDIWGSSYRVARLKSWFGLKARAPAKLDFEYNYAVSGLECSSLLSAWPYQAKWLLQRLEADAEYWANGLVFIRIGVNDIGQGHHLNTWAETGLESSTQTIINNCASEIQAVTDAITVQHPSVKVVLIGIFRNYNLPSLYAVSDRNQLENIESVLSGFDFALAEIAQGSSRTIFIDDNAWFLNRFGGRLDSSLVDSIILDKRIQISNTMGDHPANLVLADKHAGTVINGLWLMNVISQINTQFDLNLTSPSEKEIADIICQDNAVVC